MPVFHVVSMEFLFVSAGRTICNFYLANYFFVGFGIEWSLGMVKD